MSAPLFLGAEEQVQAEIRELQRWEYRHEQLHKGTSPRTHPFRVFGYYAELWFYGLKKSFVSSKLNLFHIKGHSFPWKIETEMAWALEDGRSLDKLVRIRGG